MSLLVSTNSNDVITDSVKPGGFKVGFGVVGESFFVKGSLEILQSQSVIEDFAVINSLTFDDRRGQGHSKRGSKSASLSEFHSVYCIKRVDFFKGSCLGDEMRGECVLWQNSRTHHLLNTFSALQSLSTRHSPRSRNRT